MLLDIFHNKKKSQIAVDGKVYTVEVGARFALNFKLVRIDGKCTDILFGDQKFTLCVSK